ncbi:MAG: hypothetical protein E6K54_06855 [Gammaproteobacteria bacterium]|nr:MAG: hypothetical protein E6K54_06855 [Gammaproteobacteria bacterium]
MLSIQHLTDAINFYHRHKGLIKKITGSKHAAILATETYLQSLQPDRNLISNQDLLTINRFFLFDHPVQPGKAAYETWLFINYHYFCDLNFAQVDQLAQLLNCSVPLKHAGFATCSEAGYQKFPENFSKLTLEQLDNRSNAEKMREFFNVLSAAYQHNNFSEDGFVALSKLCVQGMLNQDIINLILQNKQANFLAECMIMMKHSDILTPKNQQILIDFPYLQRLLRTMLCLEKIGLLTPENFAEISGDNNHAWLLALEEMPEALITPEIWQGLLNLLKNSHISDFKNDIKEYAEMLMQEANVEQKEKVSLISEEAQATQSRPSTSRLFLISPGTLSAVVNEEVVATSNLVP